MKKSYLAGLFLLSILFHSLFSMAGASGVMIVTGKVVSFDKKTVTILHGKQKQQFPIEWLKDRKKSESRRNGRD